MENYYNDLNLPAQSPIREVKKAYKGLAKKYHPDKNLNNQVSVKLFLKIKKAYEFLSDGERKEKYDIKLERYKRKVDIHHDPVLIKSYIKKKTPKRKKGTIIYGRKVALVRLQCEKCDGYGLILNRFSFPAACPQCDGSGKKSQYEDKH